jgi:membrane-bound acyltransferase YfiQ involved in biofilm formation
LKSTHLFLFIFVWISISLIKYKLILNQPLGPFSFFEDYTKVVIVIFAIISAIGFLEIGRIIKERNMFFQWMIIIGNKAFGIYLIHLIFILLFYGMIPARPDSPIFHLIWTISVYVFGLTSSCIFIHFISFRFRSISLILGPSAIFGNKFYPTKMPIEEKIYKTYLRIMMTGLMISITSIFIFQFY